MVARITKYGKPAKAKYRKIKRGGVMMDEHRLVMEQHLGRKLHRNECVHHKDGDTYNNALENLEVVPRSEHSRQHQRGENANTAKLTTADVIVIRASRADNRDVAAVFNVHPSTIQQIRARRTWTHI